MVEVESQEAANLIAGSTREELAARLSAIVESSDDAIVSKDLNGIIRSWNGGAERIFGYTADEAIGQSVRMLIPADRQHEEDEVLASVRRGERVHHYETVRRRKDGTMIDISLTVSPVKDADGRIIGASKIARDISVRKRAEAAMARSLRLQEEFLGLVSHELRTPISIVVGNGEILLNHLNELSPADRDQSLKDLVTQARRLQGIIENLLILSRIGRAEPIAVEPVQLERLTAASVEAFRARAPTRPVRISTTGTVPLVMGEPQLLTMVLENLLSNADKYSPAEADVEIEIRGAEEGPVELHVLDRGIGLAEDEIENIFTPFYRSASAQLQARGMGLGLAVCERVMIGQGGSIYARRRDGGGSDFAICLPRAAEVD